VGRLATVGADGIPHLVPVCFALRSDGPAGDAVYSAVDHKPKRSTRLRRLANVESTGRVCLLVDEYADDWARLWWVRLDGRGRVVRDADEVARAVDALRDKYPQYAGRPPTGPVLAVDIQRWVSWSA
jgi:PPOX class probable F420-dependent enzyme